MINFSIRERNAITSLRANGTSVKNIATAFGCNPGVIYSATKGLGMSRSLHSSVRPISKDAVLRPQVPVPSSLPRKKRSQRGAARISFNC